MHDAIFSNVLLDFSYASHFLNLPLSLQDNF